jgi:hypothetical protein
MREPSDLLWWIITGAAFLVLIGVLIYEIWFAVRIGCILVDILN